MVRCLTSVRFNMTADVLRQGAPETSGEPEGRWVNEQHPRSREIIRTWKPATDDPATTEVDEENQNVRNIACEARAVINGGIGSPGTVERWSDFYENVDYVVMQFSPSENVSKRDRVTNIRNRNDIVVWKEEEEGPDENGVYKATVFDVLGVSPVVDPFGQVTSHQALLGRASFQDA